MRWKSRSDRYGTVAIAIHWLTALAVFGLLGSGLVAANADAAVKPGILRIHATVGLAVGLLTLARIAWWVFADRRPANSAGTPPWQARAAHAAHIAFYVLILGMAASGIAMLALSGAAAILFFGAPGALPDFTLYPPRTAHGLGFLALTGLIVVHIGAALHHQFMRRDGIMARMGVG